MLYSGASAPYFPDEEVASQGSGQSSSELGLKVSLDNIVNNINSASNVFDKKPIEQKTVKNVMGWFDEDDGASYKNFSGVLTSFFKEKENYFRGLQNATIISFRVGNTYTGDYQETNKNTTIFNLSFFNAYEGTVVNSYRKGTSYGFSIGDSFNKPVNPKKIKKYADFTLYISRNVFLGSIALLFAAIMYSYRE